MILSVGFIIKNLLAVIVVTGMITDLFWMRLPNWLFILFTALFIATCVYFGIGWDIFKWNLLALVVVLVIGFPLASMPSIRAFGAGDIKFAMGIALWVGWGNVLAEYFIMTGVIGGVLSIFFLIFKKWYVIDMLPPWRWLEKIKSSVKHVPYGIALGGAFFIMIQEISILQLILK